MGATRLRLRHLCARPFISLSPFSCSQVDAAAISSISVDSAHYRVAPPAVSVPAAEWERHSDVPAKARPPIAIAGLTSVQMIGLTNSGNSCYFNALLQVHTPPRSRTWSHTTQALVRIPHLNAAVLAFRYHELVFVPSQSPYASPVTAARVQACRRCAAGGLVPRAHYHVRITVFSASPIVSSPSAYSPRRPRSSLMWSQMLCR